MKLVIPVLGSIASTVAFASAQSAASNASVPAIWLPSNASDAGHSLRTTCHMPLRSVAEWWYNTLSDGPHSCHESDDGAWSMLNAYREGGKENVHWKYTDDPNDLRCLRDWDYYAENGRVLFARISGRVTTLRDTRLWCALPVYRTGGAENNQWGYCRCRN